MTVLTARCSARARPIAARVHHRPPGARPGHDHDPDPAARKADELDWRAQPAASHRTHPPAVDVDPGACQPTTPWLPQPDSSGRRQRRGSVTRRRCSPAVPLSGGPETGWPTIPWPSLEWHSAAVQPSTRLTYGVPSATTTSRKSNSSPQRTVGLQRARRCQRCSRSQGTTSSGPLRRPLAAASRDLRKRPPHEARCLPLVVRSGRDSRSCLAPQPVANLGSGNAAKLLRLSALPRQGRRGRRRQSRTRGRCAWPGGRRCRGT